MSDWQPYHFQQRVTEYLLAGRSVILQAPTGAGKTAASLLPFLYARKNLDAGAFPRKCIYSVPMRVLANQFLDEYQSYVRRSGWKEKLNVTIQIGDRPDDPKVQGDLVFTTIDQTLSNFLNIPYALGNSSANLNAGAVLSSFLVFDELHLFDPDTMLPTALAMLYLLKDLTPFVIMTATFSSSMLFQLADLLGAVVVPEDEQARQQMEQIGSQVGKQRYFYAIDEPLTAEAVLARRGQRSICICNTVSRAQNLFLRLRDLLHLVGDEETLLCLLHSRFYKDDRQKKESWIREQFNSSQDSYDGPTLILIATQVIEVGLDATCDVMHTELAPAASLLQRAGRCARRAHESGRVHVYLPRDDDGQPDYTPYFLKSRPRQTERGRRLCQATWEALSSTDFVNQHMDFSLEQALIDRVHTPVDRQILGEIADTSRDRLDRMLQAMRSQDQGLAPELIRDINSRFVFIHPQPGHDENLERYPWYYDGFSIFPGTLARAYNELDQSLDNDAPWIMQSAAALDAARTRELEETPARLPTEYRWFSLRESKEIYTSAVLAVHPSLVRYDAETGFRFEPSDGKVILRKRPGRKRRTAYGYRRETYAQHIAGLYRAYSQPTFDPEYRVQRLPLKEEIAFIVRRLENDPIYRLAPGKLDQLLRALFACHDIGKLNIQWQAWAHRWQRQAGRFFGDADMTLLPDYMAAHMDFEPTPEQRAAQRKLGKRPNHAGESAIAAGELLQQITGENQGLWRAAMTAIARHHHAATASYHAYDSHHQAPAAFRSALQEVNLDPDLTAGIWWSPTNTEDLDSLLVQFYNRQTESVLLYLLLVRTLRLADQRSQIDGGV